MTLLPGDALEGDLAGRDPVKYLAMGDGTVAELLAALARTDRMMWRDPFAGAALDGEWWESSASGGAGVALAGGNLLLTTGPTNGGDAWVRTTRGFRIPVRVHVAFLLSQRIANQQFDIELVNAAEDVFARIELDGTTATSMRLERQNGGAMIPTTLTALTSASLHVLELDLAIDEMAVRERAIDSSAAPTERGSYQRAILDASEEYFLRLRARNTGAPASGTTFTVEYVMVQDLNELAVEVVGGRGVQGGGQAIPVVGAGGSYVLGTSTANAGQVGPKALWQDDSVSALAASATFTGTSRDLVGVAANAGIVAYPGRFRGLAVSDVAGTLYVEVSRDGSTWRRIKAVAASNAASGGLFVAEVEYLVATRYARLVYVNGAGAQAHFTLQSMMLSN